MDGTVGGSRRAEYQQIFSDRDSPRQGFEHGSRTETGSDADDDLLGGDVAALPGDLEPDSFEDMIRAARLERMDPGS